MGSARLAALTALEKCRRAAAWSDAVLGSVMDEAELSARDRGLAAALCYGVLQNRLLLDHVIGRFSTMKPAKVEPKVLDILRISAYQLIFMNKIPASAAVNEAVALCKKLGYARAAGFVNAVLRKIASCGDALEIAAQDAVQRLSLRWSHPQALVEYFIDRLGEAETGQLLRCHNESVPITVQVNTLKTDAAALRARLAEEGVETAVHPCVPNCLTLHAAGSIAALKSFREGLFYVQDAAAKMSVLAALPQVGARVLDCCAAPGGKSFAAAILTQNGEILSCDLHENKLKRIRESAARLGLDGITTRAMDARSFDPALEARFDCVIADVPCSGLGVIRKKPDIRYKNMDEFSALPEIQSAIIENVSRYVVPGGTLLYSTCTVRREENEDVVSRFLAAHGEFVAEDFAPAAGVASEGGMLQLWPHRHGTDGFFIAKMRKTK